MSGVHMAGSPREMYWELRENVHQRKVRAKLLRAIYALVDPEGWDARRLAARGQRPK